MRVYEFAETVNKNSKEILLFLRAKKIEIKSHMSVLGEKEVELLNQKYKKTTGMEKALISSSSTGSKQDGFHKKGVSKTMSDSSNTASSQKNVNAPSVASAKKIISKSVVIQQHMTMTDVASLLGLRLKEVVPFLLVLRDFSSIKDIVSVEEIIKLAESFGVAFTVEKELFDDSKDAKSLGYKEAFNPVVDVALEKKASLSNDEQKREPVVVVMGHVDHGKTTLIDFIRKTKVVDREQGGITQRVHIYKVKTDAGHMVLVDTPGHEAFVAMRGKSVKAADIAVVIVAADDGVMPQTVESIKLAKQAGSTIVVAVNKIDKPGVDITYEKIKQQLSQHDLLVEDWGGDVVCMPISAKNGTGIDELLEIVALQAEVLDLKAVSSGPCEAYVLESGVEKGIGPVAFAILKKGTLQQGDFIVAGSALGKAKTLLDAHGKLVKCATPVDSVKVTGFESVPAVGSLLRSISRENYNKFSANLALLTQEEDPLNIAFKDKSDICLSVILKADSAGVVDALKNSVEKMCKQDSRLLGKVEVTFSSAGDIFEKDILLATDRNAVILGMNVKVDKKAQPVANFHKTQIILGGIVYKIVDQFKDLARSLLVPEKEIVEIGSSNVIRVFNLKAKGVVAGCVVQSGSIVKSGKIYCMRDGKKIAEGTISSLQIERNDVDEVKRGQECGIVCKEIKVWHVGDQAVCVLEKEGK